MQIASELNCELAITIPTYNRPQSLRKTVASLLPQMQEGVSILILDNASTSAVTFESIGVDPQEWAGRITITRHPVNIGGCANIVSCFLATDAQYIWLLADDDELESDAIETILLSIRRHPEAVFINFQYTTTRVQDALFYGTDALLGGFDSWGDLLFISNSVFRAPLCRLHARQGFHFSYSYAPHLAMLFAALGKDGLAVLSSARVVQGHQEVENNMWSVAHMAISRMSILDMPMSAASRMRLAAAIYSHFGVINHTWLYCLGLAVNGDRPGAAYFFRKVCEENLRFRGVLEFVRARVLLIALKMPRLSHRLARTIFGKQRVDGIIGNKRMNADW